jgi:putative ABC transport system ATP-binding protein
VIRLENISVTFNPGTADEHRALKNIDLSVDRGDFITIIGSNGAGKSTLFNAISGSLEHASGRILLGERDISSLPEYARARYIGRIFQNPTLGTAGNMTLEDNMVIAMKKGFRGLKIFPERRTAYLVPHPAFRA